MINWEIQELVPSDLLPSFLKHYSNVCANLLLPLVKDEVELNELLYPQLKKSNHPVFDQLLKLLKSVKEDEKIMICGDYDCDGITSTTLFILICQKLGIHYGFYIPNRLKEGYGASPKTIQLAYDKGYKIVVMIDNGVKQKEAIELASLLGMKVIVIDHHQFDEVLPWDLLIHQSLLDPYYHYLSGAGLVFQCAFEWGLTDNYMFVLAMIGLVGDVMELKQQTRAIVVEGLKILQKNSFPCIDVLLKGKINLSLTDISFQIVPVFNAVGRLADQANVNQVIHYLLSQDTHIIQEFSNQLKKINEARKNLSKQHLEESWQMLSHHKIELVYKETFHEGIIGIVAGRIAREIGKPTIVMAQSEHELKASVRSIGDFDIFSFLQKFQSQFFTSFGGHKLACAFSLKKEHFPKFKEMIIKESEMLENFDTKLMALSVLPDKLTHALFNELSQFQPTGQGFSFLPFYTHFLVVKVVKLGLSGYSFHVFNSGEIKEVLYFNANFNPPSQNFLMRVIGELSKNKKGELILIAQSIKV